MYTDCDKWLIKLIFTSFLKLVLNNSRHPSICSKIYLFLKFPIHQKGTLLLKQGMYQWRTIHSKVERCLPNSHYHCKTHFSFWNDNGSLIRMVAFRKVQAIPLGYLGRIHKLSSSYTWATSNRRQGRTVWKSHQCAGEKH